MMAVMASPARQVPVVRHTGPDVRPDNDHVVIEEPLEVRIGKTSIVVTMRTPGHDAELAAGFLVSEQVVRSAAELEYISPCPDAAQGNIVIVTLAKFANVDLDSLKRNFYATSSCGLCGKASIEQLRKTIPPIPATATVRPDLISSLSRQMRTAQPVFDLTGGLHAAALFDLTGNALCIREDISRHNAVDKLIGWAALDDRLPLSDAILLVSGRAGFEIVQKAAVAGIPIIVAVSAPSSLAIDLATETNLTLIAFARDNRFVVYSVPGRVAPEYRGETAT